MPPPNTEQRKVRWRIERRTSKNSQPTQSVSKLGSVSLVVAVWTFLSVAPLAFALINTEALTRSRGPTERGRASHCCTNITQGLVSPHKERAVGLWADWSALRRSHVSPLHSHSVCIHTVYAEHLLLSCNRWRRGGVFLSYSTHPSLPINNLSFLCESSVPRSLRSVGGHQPLCLLFPLYFEISASISLCSCFFFSLHSPMFPPFCLSVCFLQRRLSS